MKARNARNGGEATIPAFQAAERAALVARHFRELRGQVQTVAGATLVSAEVAAELVAFVTFVEAHVADRSQRISARLDALRQLLDEGRRAAATVNDALPVRVLESEDELDVFDAAAFSGEKPDTLRKKLREGRLAGRRVNGRWVTTLSALENQRKEV